MRELRKLLHDLEKLRCAYHGIATAENDPEAANVAVRTTHEIAQLRMFIGGGQHSDPIQLTRQANPRGQEASTAAFERGLAFLCSSGVASPETEARVRELTKDRPNPPEEQDQDQPA